MFGITSSGWFRVACAGVIVFGWVAQGFAVTSGTATHAVALRGAAAKLGFADADAAALAAGRATARALETSNEAELAAVGIVVLPTSIDEVTESFRDLSLLERSGMALEAHRFSPDASLADLSGLDIPESDSKNLLKVKVAASDVKLSGEEIAALRGRVPPTHLESYKQSLLDRVVAWRKGGLDGLGTYADKKRPVDQAAVAKPLVERIASGRPSDTLQLADDFQYWAVVKLGDYKPLVELNHVSLYRGPGISRIETVQIYASHYCEALVTSIDFVELPNSDGRATLMRLTFRAQVDALGGLFGGLKRSIGRSKVVDQVAQGLERVRETVSSPEFVAAATRRATNGQ